VLDDTAVTPLLRRAELKRRITSLCVGTAYLVFVCLIAYFFLFVETGYPQGKQIDKCTRIL